jgi:hypothetical protein
MDLRLYAVTTSRQADLIRHEAFLDCLGLYHLLYWACFGRFLIVSLVRRCHIEMFVDE